MLFLSKCQAEEKNLTPFQMQARPFMFIAHLPAGYISARFLFPHGNTKGLSFKAFVLAGMAGAITPDTDLLYFYLVDGQQHTHHSYMTHYPLSWLVFLGCSLFVASRKRSGKIGTLLSIFSFNGFLHMVLDSVVGSIWWLAPFVETPFSLFGVAAIYQPWWLNFVRHWSFGLELLICGWAVFLACIGGQQKVARRKVLNAEVESCRL